MSTRPATLLPVTLTLAATISEWVTSQLQRAARAARARRRAALAQRRTGELPSRGHLRMVSSTPGALPRAGRHASRTSNANLKLVGNTAEPRRTAG